MLRLSLGKMLTPAVAGITISMLAIGLFTSRVLGQAAADTRLTFEVASVRPSGPAEPGRGGAARFGTSDPGQITFRGTPLIEILRTAYGVDFDQISGPAWLYDERYDIVAKLPPGTTQEQSNMMLQNLLVERFMMTLHHAAKDFPAYELTVAKGGPKLKETAGTQAKPAQPGDAPRNFKTDPNGFPEVPEGTSGMRASMNNGVTRATFRAQPISMLTGQLAATFGTIAGANRFAMGRLVDNTGLTGKYDFTLEFAGRLGPGGITLSPSVDAASDPAPDIFQALEKQLGLRLAKSTVSKDTLIVDHIEKTPTEN